MTKTRARMVSRRRKATGTPRAPGRPGTKSQAERELVHELQVYTEEVEVQNEQLLKAQSELEDARDKFADLYDLAPVGYVALDANAMIREINVAGAAMLGRPRMFLLNVPLPTLAQRSDRDRLRRFFIQAISSEAQAGSPHIEVTLKDGARIVRLIAHVRRDRARLDVLVAMIDVTQERRLEQEREAALARERSRATELALEMGERISAEERVKALLERLVGIQEEERRRLSRNLHDHLGQQLTALRLAIGAVKERERATGERNSRLGVIEAIVSDLDREIDRLAWDLRPLALDELGLSAALATLVRDWAAMTGVAAEFHASADPAPGGRLNRDVESHVYRITQEALNNIAKHARASRVSVLMKQANEELSLIIEDDGQGFAVGVDERGMGLISMRERAALMGGEVQIESMAGHGTTVFVKIPLRLRKPV